MLTKLLNRLRGREDYDVRAYELSTLRLIRKKSFRLRFLATGKLALLYHKFSQENYCAGWMSNDDKLLNEFVKWVFTRPIDSA